jgi:hypothetical protein
VRAVELNDADEEEHEVSEAEEEEHVVDEDDEDDKEEEEEEEEVDDDDEGEEKADVTDGQKRVEELKWECGGAVGEVVEAHKAEPLTMCAGCEKKVITRCCSV